MAGVALTGRLGLWQLDRAAQKEALHQQITQRAALAPLEGAAALARDAAGVQAQLYRPIRVQGHWEAGRGWFLDNRQMGGASGSQPGFIALGVLRLRDGSALLVQRGWVPRDAQDRSRVPALPLPPGEVTLLARVAPWPSRLAELGGAAAQGPIRQNVEPTALAAETGLALRSDLSLAELPAVASQGGAQSDTMAAANAAKASHAGAAPLALNRGATADPTPLRRDWPLPAADIHKHLGYAAQWFGFAALMAGLWLWFQVLRPWRSTRHER